MIKTVLSGLVGITIGVAVTSAAPMLTRNFGETAAASVRTIDAQPAAIDPYALMRDTNGLSAAKETALF